MPVELTDANFEDEVLKADVPVLVDFWAPWCGPCRLAAPVLEKIVGEYKGKVKVCRLDVDDGRRTAARYEIMGIPLFGIFKNGELVDQIIGITPTLEADLKAKIDVLLM